MLGKHVLHLRLLIKKQKIIIYNIAIYERVVLSNLVQYFSPNILNKKIEKLPLVQKTLNSFKSSFQCGGGGGVCDALGSKKFTNEDYETITIQIPKL